MSGDTLETVGLVLLNVAVALLLAPLYEGIMRKLKAALHSRIGPPITQPFLDLAKLLGKEDLRAVPGTLYAAAPAITLGSVLTLALLVPMGTRPPLGAAGDIIVLLYVAAISAVLLMLTAFAASGPYSAVGGSREMMMLLSVEPVLAVTLVVGALKSGSLATLGILDWQVENGPTVSMAIAGIAFFLALQAQAGKLPFDVAEADQEVMGGPLVEQSGPRLALFRWALWSKQLLFAILLVELFLPWPRFGLFPADLVLTLLKALLILVLVAVVDVVNPRLRIDQTMGYFMRVAFSSLAALAFAVIGM
ncbi:MAG: NADH-quinone oxidoreductase subunit H [Gemmatimonadota bacterium]|nr:MAG: NADH-quinone oxidoreductase subunit H [Gemmatimonadota bacterium]